MFYVILDPSLWCSFNEKNVMTVNQQYRSYISQTHADDRNNGKNRHIMPGNRRNKVSVVIVRDQNSIIYF